MIDLFFGCAEYGALDVVPLHPDQEWPTAFAMARTFWADTTGPDWAPVPYMPHPMDARRDGDLITLRWTDTGHTATYRLHDADYQGDTTMYYAATLEP